MKRLIYESVSFLEKNVKKALAKASLKAKSSQSANEGNKKEIHPLQKEIIPICQSFPKFKMFQRLSGSARAVKLFMQIWELRKIAMLSKLKYKLISDESKEKSIDALVIASLSPSFSQHRKHPKFLLNLILAIPYGSIC